MVALHGSTEYIGGLLPNIVDEKIESNLQNEIQLNFKAHLQSLTIKIQNLIEEQRKQKGSLEKEILTVDTPVQTPIGKQLSNAGNSNDPLDIMTPATASSVARKANTIVASDASDEDDDSENELSKVRGTTVIDDERKPPAKKNTALGKKNE